MQKIVPCLWFNNEAEEAARFYVSVFKDGKIEQITHYGPGLPGLEGSVMTVTFLLHGQRYMGLNAGPHDKFNEAISLMVHCDTQQEIDRYWEKLTADGGQEIECGWLKDKYGLAWQIVPSILGELMSVSAEQTNRLMQAVITMKKLNIAELQAAALAQ